jgi:hypothetical protein
MTPAMGSDRQLEAEFFPEIPFAALHIDRKLLRWRLFFPGNVKLNRSPRKAPRQ